MVRFDIMKSPIYLLLSVTNPTLTKYMVNGI
jgi:hypothetical protein